MPLNIYQKIVINNRITITYERMDWILILYCVLSYRAENQSEMNEMETHI